ncbi:MAG: hypothetical protein Q9162_007002 [Coniocarpon cinnabarinum]
MGKLIRLELCNFKSYKGHHALLFGNANWTSIIGPNGSGKSNSMDAISFVLGIKSSHLRSTHLRDLIYRGRILKTSKVTADGNAEEPQQNGISGARTNGDDAGNDDDVGTQSQRQDATTAWVMAVYEDDAGEEQHWKRTITSAGQSEYRINNRNVTAKEYNEVLEAENILIKARNFLVFQGDVEAIASQTPKELTRLVEQISGSLDYKADYDSLEEEKEKALEDLQFKSTQRRGINAEIKTYGDQKTEADDYNKKQDERDAAVIDHVLWKLYHFQQVIEESEQEIQRHQEELKEQRRGIQKYEGSLDDAKKDQTKAHKELQKAERSINSTEKRIDDKMHDLVPVDEKIEVSSKNLEKYNKRTTEVSKERDNQAKTVEQLRKSLNTVAKAQKKWDDDFQKLSQSQGKQLGNGDMQEYNRLKADVDKRAATSKIQVDSLMRQCKTDEETVANLKANVDDSSRQVDRLSGELADIQNRRKAATAKVKEVSPQIENKKKEINSITSERLKVSQKQTELDEKLHGVLQKLLEANDGRQQSRKEMQQKEVIATLKRIFPGVRGRVHELCRPKQKKYDTAVSTVLGRNFDTIVVDNEKAAKDCIQYLRDQRIGRADFIPLDTIQVKGVNSSMKGMHKHMRLAIDTIDYDSSLERAMLSVCGNAMVCDDLQTARHLCFERHIEAKAVTLDGTVIHKAGLMTGGRGKDDRNNRKWDDTEIDNLTKLKDNLMAQIHALPNDRKAITDEEVLRGELVGLEQQNAYAHEESKALEKNEESKKKELKFVQSQLKEMRPKYESQAADLATLKQRIEDSQDEVGKIEDQVFAAFCKKHKFDNIRVYDKQQGSLQQEARDKKLEFDKQKNTLENQISFEENRLQSTSARVSSLQAQHQRDEELIAALNEEKEAMQTELDNIRDELETAKSKVSDLKTSYDKQVERVASQRRELQERSKKIDFIAKEVSKHEADVQRNASQRYAQLRKCKIEGIKLPLTAGSKQLDSLPLDDVLREQQQGGAEDDPDAMDVDVDPDASLLAPKETNDYGISVDFTDLSEELQEDDSRSQDETLQKIIASLNAELSQLNPNMRAIDRLHTAEGRLKQIDTSYREAQRFARETTEAFETVREKRAHLFEKAYQHIHDEIKPVYRALTTSEAVPLGGQAYLDNEAQDDSKPFDGGLRYHAMPPLKRFRDMEALSGGEKTIAALALLFAIHSYAPSPFFVLDEVDAALDVANVAKVARYLRNHARPGMQFIVISLKTGLFQESDALVGVHRDQGANSSRTVTLDLRKYRPN